MSSGIYSIINKENGKLYVGLTGNIETRRSKHFSLLRHNKHFNRHLQASWNKYGEEAFEFNVLEYCPIDKLSENEDWWINYFDSTNSDNGYNLREGGHSNFHLSESTKQILRELNLHRQKENHDCWGTSIIEDYGGLWFLETMASTGISCAELCTYLGVTDGAIHSYLKTRDTSWSELSPNSHVPRNSRRAILLDLGGLDFLKSCKEDGMTLVEIADKYNLGSRSVIHKYLKSLGLSWSKLNG